MAATGVARPLSAQSGGDVLRTALDRYEARMEGVESYTVVQEVMGFESQTRFERREVEGRSTFVPRTEDGSTAARGAPQAPYTEFIALADRATLEGTATVDGEESHVVTVTDFEGVDVWNPAGGGRAGDFIPERASFYIDTDDYLIRRMEMSGTASVPGGDEEEVSFVVDFRDYREVEGLIHPFVLQVTVAGLAGQISPEQREELRSSLEEMRARMAEMSEEQRQMVEETMSGQLERMETMLAQGTMGLTVEVTEIRVNEGPSGDDR